MIKRFFLALVTVTSSGFFANAQDTLAISGSVDTYYKYDFDKLSGNIPTSFALDHNSVSLGMLDLALKKTTGKSSFVGELSFGPRGQSQSIPNAAGTYDEDDNSFHIQNLYVNYAFCDKFSMTAGFMSTFIGYEVIAPAGNFNYSTSYLFSNGPFQNAGIKANVKFTDKVGLMVGLFNDSWNSYTANPAFGVSTFGAQLSLTPVDGWNAYLNLATGYISGTELDLTTSYQVNDKFKVGLNVADWSAGSGANDTGFTGGALYLSNAFTPAAALGVRFEAFKTKVNGGVAFGPAADESVLGLTLSGNLKSGGFTFIPEIRFDNGSANMFNGFTSKSASQFSLAAVYAF
jgi:hypothetical protein